MIKSGIAQHGSLVDLGTGWSTKPTVLVSPFTLPSYMSVYPDDQVISVGVTTLYEDPLASGNWWFIPDVSLRQASGQGSLPLSLSSGLISADTWTSSVFTTPANVDEITVSVSVNSKHGNGYNWNARQVNITVQYLDSGVWVDGEIISDILLDTETHNYTLTNEFPSSAAWDVRVKIDTSDYLTAIFGDLEYTYDQQTLNLAGSRTGSVNVSPTTPFGVLAHLLNYPGTALPGQRYKTEYFFESITFTSVLQSSGLPSRSLRTSLRLNKINPTTIPSPKLWGVEGTHNTSINPINRTLSNQTFSYQIPDDETTISAGTQAVIGLETQAFDGASGSTSLNITGVANATFYYRTLVPTSTTVQNDFTITGYEYINAGSVLETGICSWLAIE